MTAYIPTGTVFHTAYDLPAAGAPATAASVNDQALKYLGDNTQYLYNLTLPLTAGGNFTPAAAIVLQGLSAGLQVPSGLLQANTLNVGSNETIGGSLNVTGNGTFGGTLFAAGFDGRFQTQTLTDPGGIVTVDRRKFYYGASLPGSNTTWFLDSTGEALGDWAFFQLGGITNTITISCSDGALVTLSTGGNHWALVMRLNDGSGTHWAVLARGNTP